MVFTSLANLRANFQLKADFPDPLLPRQDLSMSLPPGMDKETERGLWAYLQNAKDRAREMDAKAAAAKEEDEKKAASK